MQINLVDLREASRCLKLYSFMKNSNRKYPSKFSRIVEKVIKKAYIQSLKSGFRVNWRRIIGWVDQEVIIDSSILDNKENWKQIRLDSEYCLKFLSVWYNKTYLVEDVATYVDLSLSYRYSGITVSDIIPIIKSFEIPVITVVSDTLYTKWSMYNDISIRGLGWLAYKSLDTTNFVIEAISPGIKGRFQRELISINEESLERTDRMIETITTMIKLGIDYPSVTDDCNNCSFKKRCYL